MDERWSDGMGENVEASPMSHSPAVRCTGCGFAWNSAVMADGLRLLGSCPKCDGELEFRADPPRSVEEPRVAPVAAPHLVLGIPRR